MAKRVFCLAALLLWAFAPVLRAEDEAEAKKAKIPGLKLWLKLDETEGKKSRVPSGSRRASLAARLSSAATTSSSSPPPACMSSSPTAT